MVAWPGKRVVPDGVRLAVSALFLCPFLEAGFLDLL